ncbi:MAG TPA: FKBP-type peptidyl-prolyl cis-trans isomerase [Steroidobacteraceae bacterium]
MTHTRTAFLRDFCMAGLLLAAAAPLGAQTPAPGTNPPPAAAAAGANPTAPSADDIGYLFGLSFGEQMHNVGITDQLSPEALSRGLKDGMQGKKTTPADRAQVQGYIRSVMDAAVARNEAQAKDFLARNGREKGVTTTASGLQYRILLPGDRKAAAITPTDGVTVQYRGKLIDGTQFDSTYDRNAPASFAVNGVIPGWQEALLLMKPGAKWQLFVPPELGYGKSPKPGIPAGSLLIFEVELLSVKSSSGPPVPPGTPANPPAPRSK